MQRLWKDPEKIKDTDPFFMLVRKAGADPRIAEDLKMVSSTFSICIPLAVSGEVLTMRQMHIGHDMTQYFNKSELSGRKDDLYDGGMPEVALIENAAVQV